MNNTSKNVTEADFIKYAQEKFGYTEAQIKETVQKTGTPSAIISPSIVEEREMNMHIMSVFDRLLKERILWVSGVVDIMMSDIIQAQLLFLDSVDNSDITMYLNTPGGSVDAGLGMVDVMNFIQSDVATVNVGMCASMGSILLGAGTKGKRSGLINSKVMTHQVSYGAQGNIQSVRITGIEAEKANYLLFRRIAEATGKTIDEVLEISKEDNWLNSDEAVEFGIMDKVIGLTDSDGKRIKGVLSITEQLDGFNDHYQKIIAKLLK